MHDILKVAEVAEMLRVSKATVQRWCAAGKLPAFKIGQHWRINGPGLREMLADLSGFPVGAEKAQEADHQPDSDSIPHLAARSIG